MPSPSDPPLRRAHAMPFGPLVEADATTFRLWAPLAGSVDLLIEGEPRRPMAREADGWFTLRAEGAGPGTAYRFVLPDGTAVPDPASRFQPQDVHGPSEVVDPAAYPWRDGEWRGRLWPEALLYEAHVGTFTPEGTFAAMAGRLDHLTGLGVTGLCLMPVADFPGRWNWGYDGVLPYAPDATYGRPEDLKALVEAAHARGLMVLMDVVYNHFGPDGNYLPLYAPIFNPSHPTPWGPAVNVDGDGSFWVREYLIHNALYWLEEFHLDGLRLDAVHAIRDEGEQNVLEELARRARAATAGRPIHLILENEENNPALLRRDADGTAPLYTAQWNDDVHHGLHVALTGEDEAYYADYAADLPKLARALAEGFAFQGETMSYRGSPRGGPSAELPPLAFVAFLQNHDQVGNRACGDRLEAGVPDAALRAAVAILMLSPQVPMLFMGQEFLGREAAARHPFAFFCDFAEPLAEAVRTGRRAEFSRFRAFADPAARETIPDPTARETRDKAVLDWAVTQSPESAATLALYRDLAALRRERILPLLPAFGPRCGEARVHGSARLLVTWRTRDGTVLGLDAQLGPESAGPGLPGDVEILRLEGLAEPGALGPWTACFWIREPG